jgi:hypothetical protein
MNALGSPKNRSVLALARAAREATGRARQLCPRTSDVDFLGDLKRVVDLNA